jgi:hypothetical protein
MSVNFYTFSFHNPERKQRMTERFEKEGLTLEFVDPVEADDARVIPAPNNQKRTWAIMFNHLDMLKAFLESDAEYGVFCEDDIYIRKGFHTYIDTLVHNYKKYELEILLIGYLLPHSSAEIKVHPDFKLMDSQLLFLKYTDDLWGSQMYMLDRQTASNFLRIYNVEYALKSERNPNIPYFSPDWTLTKVGKRAIVYPMLAVEEGAVVTSHGGQASFHQRCTAFNYNPDLYH